jgi:hypothetical protein
MFQRNLYIYHRRYRAPERCGYQIRAFWASAAVFEGETDGSTLPSGEWECVSESYLSVNL